MKLETVDNLEIAHPYIKGFDKVTLCANEQEKQEAAHGAILVRQPGAPELDSATALAVLVACFPSLRKQRNTGVDGLHCFVRLIEALTLPSRSQQPPGTAMSSPPADSIFASPVVLRERAIQSVTRPAQTELC
ncbi:hypothetical protein BDK51DRAFT_43969 [Blyttiomyces helicus]|uniref:Poly(A) polymerase RNA-binding domain-containing protein n=1 Tax=Blyttiomyces helicus TaxID=388810 RepID=A0A4P9W3G2_9FUNG|nr:hypothetical protein BDK51DRAFT_43969 [Blyttiomyces helicus]|eukprot:RKO85200.1 hypothetical protein BDK51DRAFT_43969 [Blyttiomyces helicus]